MRTEMTKAGEAVAATALIGLDRERVRAAVERLVRTDRPRYRRLWAYFKNTMRVCGAGAAAGSTAAANADRPYRQAQEWGLPGRITGVRSGYEPFDAAAGAGVSRKEVVIENDIGWRVETMAIVFRVLGKLWRGLREAYRERDRRQRGRGRYLRARWRKNAAQRAFKGPVEEK